MSPRPPRDPGQVNVAIRFPPDLHARLKAQAEAEDLNVSQLLRRLVREYLDKEAPDGHRA